MRAQPAATLLLGLAAHGNGGPDGRNDPPLSRRRARLSLLVPLDVRRGVRRAREVVCRDPEGHPVRRRRSRRVRRDDRCRRGLEHGRRSARRSGRDHRVRRGRPFGADGGGCRRRRARDRRRRDARQARGGAQLRRNRRRSLGRLGGGDRGGRSGGVGRRRRLRDRGDGSARGDDRGVPVDARTRGRSADRDPTRRRDRDAPGGHDRPDGAADPRLDLRFIASRIGIFPRRSMPIAPGGSRSIA